MTEVCDMSILRCQEQKRHNAALRRPFGDLYVSLLTASLRHKKYDYAENKKMFSDVHKSKYPQITQSSGRGVQGETWNCPGLSRKQILVFLTSVLSAAAKTAQLLPPSSEGPPEEKRGGESKNMYKCLKINNITSNKVNFF
jgi:hypothetical protein